MAGEFQKFVVGRRRRSVEPVLDRRRITSDAVCDGLHDRSGIRLRAKAEPGHRSLQRGRAQGVGSAVPCTSGTVQATTSLDRLGSAHNDWEFLCYQGSEPPDLPQCNEQHD